MHEGNQPYCLIFVDYAMKLSDQMSVSEFWLQLSMPPQITILEFCSCHEFCAEHGYSFEVLNTWILFLVLWGLTKSSVRWPANSTHRSSFGYYILLRYHIDSNAPTTIQSLQTLKSWEAESGMFPFCSMYKVLTAPPGAPCRTDVEESVYLKKIRQADAVGACIFTGRSNVRRKPSWKVVRRFWQIDQRTRRWLCSSN